MKLLERIINSVIDRMSREEKEALIQRTLEKFLSDLTPEEKQQLVERMIPQLLEGADMKEILPSMLKTMWKNLGTDGDEAGIVERMSKAASETGEKFWKSFRKD